MVFFSFFFFSTFFFSWRGRIKNTNTSAVFISHSLSFALSLSHLLNLHGRPKEMLCLTQQHSISVLLLLSLSLSLSHALSGRKTSFVVVVVVVVVVVSRRGTLDGTSSLLSL